MCKQKGIEKLIVIRHWKLIAPKSKVSTSSKCLLSLGKVRLWAKAKATPLSPRAVFSTVTNLSSMRI